MKLYDSIKDSIAFSLNNIKQEVNTTSKMRGFESALAESLENSRLKRETLDALWSSIDDYLPHFRKYFKHKAKLLGYEGGLNSMTFLQVLEKVIEHLQLKKHKNFY